MKLKGGKRRKKLKRLETDLTQVSHDMGQRDFPKGYATTIALLNATGRIQLTSVVQLQTAKMLYVVKMQGPAQIAAALGLSVELIYRWKNIWDWDSLREAMEQRLYWQASRSLRKVAPDIDITHDRLAVKMEAILERSMDDLMKKGADLKDVKELSMALQSVISLRRVIKGKVTKKESSVKVEHQFTIDQPAKMAQLERIVTAHVMHPSKLIEETREKDEITDVEFEEVG